jgi:hypothetical protein
MLSIDGLSVDTPRSTSGVPTRTVALSPLLVQPHRGRPLHPEHCKHLWPWQSTPTARADVQIGHRPDAVAVRRTHEVRRILNGDIHQVH